MSFDVDEEILQDFLVEAGEILEQLQEQLVDLENNPEDANLLNAIFRGYHTVKGGAGFLSLTELVEICHGAENVFDVMRNGQRTLTPELMDIILQATDVVVDMFERVKSQEPLEPADAKLVDTLHKLSKPESPDENIFDTDESAPSAQPEIASEPELDIVDEAPAPASSSGDIDEISEDEFEALLDELHGSSAPGKSAPGQSSTSTKSEAKAPAAQSPDVKSPDVSSGSGDDITDDEFEALLDDLHGKGKFSAAEESAAPSKPAPQSASASGDEEITDDEFEALLDQLHGSGQGPTVQSAADTKAPQPNVDKAATEAIQKAKQSAPAVAKAAPAAAAPSKAASAAPASKDAGKKDEKKAAPSAPPAETTVRVDTKRLDQIMNMVGELVLVRNRLISLGINTNDESMSKAIANLDVVTGDLQGAVMKTRMQPIKKVFGRFPRVVRDLARSLKKEITLELEGEETDLDKNLVEALADPLVHLVRNSVDHGVEMPDDRAAAGKPRMGTVKLSASQEGDHILLTIEDDGKGMDPEKLKEIAISRGVLDADAAARMSDVEAFNLIFAPGFSTKTEISDISGRGVGMDVVKTKINQLNGTVNIDSQLGKGTRLEIKVPLTLAILPTLMIIIGKQTFALPLGSVSEIINMDIKKTNTVDGQLTMIVRSKAIPLFFLGDWLIRGPKSIEREKGHVVVLQVGTRQVGFVVDALIGQEEVVIKPLDALLQGTPGMAGATITSDGGIALILDIPSLLKRYARKP
ncbi:chemotaxis protein CheA [Alteromonas sp.]|uniref:chemotaxis protein CheA n=1 Tax=Alteromonas sp. TaxID=232 RepID=UPI000B645C32|nr:chemotaxis protein CheA [Alteromonas sp.]MAI38448.1 chemotaxis protein CheA [Alteromonas sp.]OUX85729.1 MAG: chemotaxis protein CheA [Alteromonas sp. TMED35]|tara:strand:+ start:178710 stop:180968 length:2259 start_codon:yes stop_codon:yes gene_type:complete